MNHHTHEVDAGRIHNVSLAHTMANAVHAEKNAELLRNPDRNNNLDNVALTAGVIDLIGHPQELADFAREHLDVDINAKDSGYVEAKIEDGVKVSREVAARVIAKIATTEGSRVQIELSDAADVPQASVSRVIKGLWMHDYMDKENSARTPGGRTGTHITPTKSFARELAQNSTWQRAVMIQKLATQLGTTEDQAVDYALQQALQEK